MYRWISCISQPSSVDVNHSFMVITATLNDDTRYLRYSNCNKINITSVAYYESQENAMKV